MKLTGYLIFAVFVLFNQAIFSQKIIEFAKVQSELKNSSESLNITLRLPNSEFYISLTKDVIIENIQLDPCIDIESNEEKSRQLIKLLNELGLLEKLYLEIDDEYFDLNTGRTFKPIETKIILDLFFKTKDYGYIDCYLPIYDAKIARNLLTDLSEMFDEQYCFKKMKQKM